MMSSKLIPTERELHPYDLSRAVCYDLEVYKNLFTATFWNGKNHKLVFEISERKNQLFGLLQYLRTKPLLVGFNNSQYDNTILHYLLSQKLNHLSTSAICKRLYELSKAIIHFNKQNEEIKKAVGKLRFQEHFPWLDMLEVIREGYSIKGLKAVGVNLKWPRIQDLPYPFDHQVQLSEIDEILEYNFNDVLVTEAVLKEVTTRLHMRAGFSEKYNLHCYSDADSRIAKTTLNKFYAEYSGQSVESFQRLRTKRKFLTIRELVFPWVKFTSPEMLEFFEELCKQNITIGEKESSLSVPPKYYYKPKAGDPQIRFPYNGLDYTIALGGLHSTDPPGVFVAEEGILIWDMDVASQYPRCILNNKVCPAHLKPEHFLGTLDFMVTERLMFKALGKKDPSAKVAEAGLKIAINTAYGLFNSLSFWLYDPKCTYQVTINNQLSLLMLVERLNLAGIEVLSANTDGLIIRTHKDNYELVKDIQAQWQVDTGFELEDTFYTKYIRRDINNYITLKEDGEAKVKGIFIPQGGILKGYDKPIIAISLRNYFIGEIPVDYTIRTLGTPYTFSNLLVRGEERVTDIYDYCMAQKVGHTFDKAECEYADGTTKDMQRSLRYYASNTGVKLYKVKTKEDGVIQRNTLLADSAVTLFNDYCEGPYDINFQYYIDETNKIIAAIEGREIIDTERLLSKLSKLCERVDKLQPLWDKYEAKYAASEKIPKVYYTTQESLLQVQKDIIFILNQLTPC